MTTASAPHRRAAAHNSLVCHLRRATGREHNPLCRRTDRARSRLLCGASLALALSLALATAITLVLLRSMESDARQTAPHRHQVTATTLSAAVDDPAQVAASAHAQAAWDYPSASPSSGTVEVPSGTAAGTAVQIWVDDGGAAAAPPRQAADIAVAAAGYGVGALAGLWAAIGIGYVVRRRVLDHRADLAWEPAWEQVEPLWSGRSRRPESGDR